MNRRLPFACGRSGKLVNPSPTPRPQPAGGHATWDEAALREAARQALTPPSKPEPERREFYHGWDGQEYEVQR